MTTAILKKVPFVARNMQETVEISFDCAQWRSQPKNLWEGNTFDFRRITLFYLEKCLSKHKMTLRSKSLERNMDPFPPWLRL